MWRRTFVPRSGGGPGGSLKMGSRCESGAVPATVSGIPNGEVNEPLTHGRKRPEGWEGDFTGRESGDLPERFFWFGALPGRGASVSAALMRFVASGCLGALLMERVRRWRLLFGLNLLLAGTARPCAGQTAAPADTTRRTVQLPAAHVEGAWKPGSASLDQPAAGTHEQEFSAMTLHRLGAGASLATFLAQTTPLAIRQYGPGQLASLSVRGTSAQHVAVLWAGFNISFPALGQVDLSLLPAVALSGARLRPGPDATRAGSGAIGGVLELETAESNIPRSLAYWEKGAEATLSFGAFRQRALHAEISEGHRYRTSVQVAQATNDFPYHYRTFRGPQTARQTHAATESYSVTQSYTQWLKQNWQLTAAAWLTGADRHLPPAFNTPNTDARQRDHSQRVALTLLHRVPDGNGGGLVRTRLAVASLTDAILYRDRPNGPSDTRQQSWQAQAEHALPLSPRLDARLGGEAQHFRARADGYGPGLRTENRAAAFGEVRWQAPGLLGRAALRQAVVQNHRVPLMPTLSAEWWPLPRRPLRLTATAARAYRAATLNERYWRPGGNPDLLPETSDSYQVGATWETPSYEASRPISWLAEVVGFDQRVRNWVQWTPDATTGLWSPRNLRRVRSRGLEGRLRWQRTTGGTSRRGGEGRRGTTVQFAGQLLQTRDVSAAEATPLPFVPARTGSLTLTHRRSGPGSIVHRPLIDLVGELTATVTSQRTTLDSGTETLPAYGLLNAALGGEWTLLNGQRGPTTLLTLRLDGFNLLGTQYQSQPNRPMPGRSWQVTLAARRW